MHIENEEIKHDRLRWLNIRDPTAWEDILIVAQNKKKGEKDIFCCCWIGWGFTYNNKVEGKKKDCNVTQFWMKYGLKKMLCVAIVRGL